jgi:Concanavalin A-like lectin/glucanases superfamily/PEP-CTERM motif
MRNTNLKIRLIIAVALGSSSVALMAPNAEANSLIGQWTFEAGEELRDKTGNFGNLFLGNGATVSNGKLNVGINQFAHGATYKGPKITDKTLVSWVSLDNINIGSGSALTLQNSNGSVFDAIVYGEREKNRWMAGSDYFRRTVNLRPGFAETSPNQLVQMAITYGNKDIKVYRDSLLIGSYTHNNNIASFDSTASVLFGRRHGTPRSGPGTLDATIEEARIYNGVLSATDLSKLTFVGQSVKSVPEPASILGLLSIGAVAVGGVLKKKK